MSNTIDKIKVMQAFVDGSLVQKEHGSDGNWRGDSDPSWSWFSYNYRIKPETLEEFACDYSISIETPSIAMAVIAGAKWQKEQDKDKGE